MLKIYMGQPRRRFTAPGSLAPLGVWEERAAEKRLRFRNHSEAEPGIECHYRCSGRFHNPGGESRKQLRGYVEEGLER